ncbi:MAG: tetratricopeptide repeat protein [Prevotella sp.]|nr:tetratricopeptide repeat protein [Prevotella sp.]
MTNKEYFHEIFKCLSLKQLGKAIQLMHSYMADNPAAYSDQSLHSIEEDYTRMLNYMEQGFQDPDRDSIYQKLLQRMWTFTANAHIGWLCREVSFYRETQQRSLRHMFTQERILNTLQNFVTETAMLSLESEEARSQQEKEIYARHHDFIRALFDRLFVSSQWEQSQLGFYRELLLSPAVDAIDQQIIISAITLSCLTQFDPQKFRLLVSIHEQATIVEVRERAFTGWALCLQRLDLNVWPEFREELLPHFHNHSKELAEVQRQIICCINADRDNETIQRDIMPNILRNSNFRMTQNGFEEIEDDPMEDILHPEAADEKTDELERTMQQMINMQKQGSDIYFGGFKQMKRYGFFYTLSNWFTPFYIQHPDLNTVSPKAKSGAFINSVVDNGVFCNSDKYSFILSFSSVIDHLPQEIQKLMESGSDVEFINKTLHTNTPMFTRLFYLQDLYRFFQLHPQKKEFVYTPFEKNNGLNAGSYFIISHDIFSDFDNQNAGDMKFLLLRARLFYNHFRFRDAIDDLSKIEGQEPDNEQSLSLHARSLMGDNCFEDAVGYYEHLLKLNPDNKNYQFMHALALTKAGEYEEAVNELYRLKYEYPDNIKYSSTLAWVLMSLGRDEQAEREYENIIEKGKPSMADYLNAGYCYWFRGNIHKAVTYFRDFMKKKGANDLYMEFRRDEELLSSHGITVQDRMMMLELAQREPQA